MTCSSCGNEAMKGIDFCKNCLVRAVEKRARKELGKAGVSRGMNIAVVNSGNCAGEVNEHLARKFITIASIKILKKAKAGFDIVLTEETANDKAEKMMEMMLESKKLKGVKNAICLLKDSLLSEIDKYAGIKNIKYRTEKKNSCAAGLIGTLEARYKGTTFSMAKSYEQLK